MASVQPVLQFLLGFAGVFLWEELSHPPGLFKGGTVESAPLLPGEATLLSLGTWVTMRKLLGTYRLSEG